MRRLLVRIVMAVALAGPTLLALPVRAATWLGTLGDSLTEPYAEVDAFLFESFLRPAGVGWPILGTPAPADPTPMNWVDQLQTLGSHDSTVRNYGLGGADSTTLLEQGQHLEAAADAAAQIAAGNRAFASIGIGTNNFLPFGFSGQINTYGGIQDGCTSVTSCSSSFTGSNGLSYTRVDFYVADIMREFRTALEELQSSGADVVVLGPGAWSTFPATPLSAGLPPNAIVDEAVDLLIQQQRAEALARGLPFVDIQALLEDFPDLTVGGVALLEGHPDPGTREPRHWFLPDGIHPDTIASGLVANAMITALNEAYGAGLGPLDDAEILGLAGLAASAGWDGTSIDLSSYVTVPEPSSRFLALVAVLASSWLGRRRRPVSVSHRLP